MPTDRTNRPIKDRTDWAYLKALDDGEIERIADTDEDNPATLSDDEWADAFVGARPPSPAPRLGPDGNAVDT